MAHVPNRPNSAVLATVGGIAFAVACTTQVESFSGAKANRPEGGTNSGSLPPTYASSGLGGTDDPGTGGWGGEGGEGGNGGADDDGGEPDSGRDARRASDAPNDVSAPRDGCNAAGAALSTFYVADLKPIGIPINGLGPIERDMSNGDAASGDGRTMSISGTTYAKGLGTHANSSVEYGLGGKCTTFSAFVGPDDEASPASITFEVWIDGTRAYSSPALVRSGQPPAFISLNVSCASSLRLVVTDGVFDGNSHDHADWAEAKLACSSIPGGVLPDASVDPKDGAPDPKDSAPDPRDGAPDPKDSAPDPKDSAPDPKDSAPVPEDAAADHVDSSVNTGDGATAVMDARSDRRRGP